MRHTIQSCGPKSILVLLTLIFTACTAAQKEEAPAPIPEAVAPPEVEAVREAALDFLREGANCMVPPAGAAWNASTVDNEATTGARVYRFTTDTCALTVSYPDPTPAEPLYYVALRSADNNFCWQAVVDRGGHVTATGYEQIEPDFINPARAYCEQEGGTFELRTREDGSLCGACVFEDGAVCNAWDFFYGECTTATGG